MQAATESKSRPQECAVRALTIIFIAMGILRMIKLFGWEPKIAARLAEKREQELQFIKIRQILNLINGNIK